MQILEILKQIGIPTKEIKQRFANRQIKVNGNVVDALDHDIPIQDGYWELGDFIYECMKSSDKDFCRHLTMLKFYFNSDITTFFGGCNMINNKAAKFLSGFVCLTLSKKEHIVFIKS